ncbi:hypothetical protein Tsubulata_031363 [Turnera subulata]|uniref:Glutamyl/glutaminyl-tRNA synthetase class Ib catalytic domain-containing protein n=1 Tax=Turnera subulata TaxID=218843 RepID=A0A9Q0JMI4_9ROSI|nr:hypothetical protein Tsubulata_031363 [Turnera subulata]
MSTSNVAGGRSPLADLPAAVTGEVRLRFAPEPSGFLHIGHAKAALLNQEYASRYQGHLILRFDDTNPLKESQEFVENILRDTATLGLRYEEVTYTSDYFHDLMKMAERLIQEGKAYVDDAPKESKQDDRFLGIESKCRSNSVEQNLDLWGEMVRGSEKGLQCCLRGKLDMKSPNKCLRDPVYYRCVAKPHHRVETQQFNVYPTYDFACPFVDSVQGITHALRSSEYTDRNPLYHRIQEDMGMRKVHVVEISRLNLAFTPLSKRHLKFFVQNGMVEGWDDPRLPTVQGIIRRGLKVDALTQFVAQLVSLSTLILLITSSN